MKKIIGGVAALVAGTALALGGVAAATWAHTPSESNSCQGWSVALDNYDSGATADVVVDGVSQHTGTFGGTLHLSGAYTSDASHTSHELKVTVDSQDGDQYDVDYDNTATGCYTAPPPKTATPIAPTASAGVETCVDGESQDANGVIHLPAFEGGHFAEHAAGDITDVAPGEYGFTPVADDGYTLSSDDMVFVTVPASVDVDCTPPQPDAKVTTTDWVDGTYACGDTTVTQTRDVVTTSYVLVDGDWVLDTENATTVQETQTRDLTAAEVAAEVCPTTPPVDTPPSVPAASEQVLAHTGVDEEQTEILGGAALLLLLIGAGTLVLARRYDRSRSGE